jgi:hypothetical protein
MIIDSNKMKYNTFFFLDDTDTKKKMKDTNTEKLKGTLKKMKITKDMTLFQSLADVSLVIMWSRSLHANTTIPRKPSKSSSEQAHSMLL